MVIGEAIKILPRRWHLPLPMPAEYTHINRRIDTLLLCVLNWRNFKISCRSAPHLRFWPA
jgi:hypothetical protein